MIRTASPFARRRATMLRPRNPVPPKTATVDGALMAAPLFLFARSRLCFPVLRLGEFRVRLGRLRVAFTSRRIAVLACRFPLGGMPQLTRALIQVHAHDPTEDHLPQHR